MEELQALGFRSVPVTVVGERTITGFQPNQLSQALQLDVTVAPRDPAETLPLLDRVLTAVHRAVLQMPEDKLQDHAPDRARPMGEFAYHIFRMVKVFTDLISTGEAQPGRSRLDPPGIAELDLPGRSFENFKKIAEYGTGILEEYRGWVAQQDVEALRAASPPGSNARSGAEQLDQAAHHTTQHLRQLYFMLEKYGIAPEDRLPDSELPPEYVLTILW